MTSERPSGADLGDAVRQLRRHAEDAERRAVQFQQVGAQLEAVRSTGEVANGAIRVTVSGSGAVVDVRITDKARTMTADELSRQVLACVRRAQSGLTARASEIIHDTVTDESDTSRRLTERIVSGFRQRYPDVPADASPGRERSLWGDEQSYEHGSIMR